MSAPTIISGSVTYGESRKIGDYENRKIEVTLAFNASTAGTVTEADTATVLDMAQKLVVEKHANPTKPAVTASAVTAPVATAPAAPTATTSPATSKAAEKQKSSKTPDPTIPAQPGHPAALPATSATPAPTAPTASPSIAPIAPATAPTATPVATAPTAPATTAAAPEVADPLLSGPITDAALADEIRKVNDANQGKKFSAIRTLIAEFSTAANHSFTGIPEDKRGEFLVKLGAV